MKQFKAVILMMAAMLVMSACMPVQPETDVSMSAQEASSQATYAAKGHFDVGYQAVTISDNEGRDIGTGLWYPALNEDGLDETITYQIEPKVPEMFGDGPAVVYGQALENAAINSSSGPYPLVVFSHGFGLNAAAYHTIPEHLASYGFIVLAPEHIEGDWFESMAAVIDRPRDIVRTLDYAEALNTDDTDFANQIDMDNVAVMGHSYGGYTTLAMAGAQIDLNAFNERCAALPEDSPEQFLCAPIAGRDAEMAQYAGLADVPDGLWPSYGDERVDAIMPIAGDAFLFDTKGLASITIPMLAIGGTADTGTPYEWGSKMSYDFTSSAEKSLVGLVGAEHMVAGSSCDDMPWTDNSPYAPFICDDPVWDKDAAHDVIHHYVTAFLLATLKEDADARTQLLPDTAQFEGIEYTTTFE